MSKSKKDQQLFTLSLNDTDNDSSSKVNQDNTHSNVDSNNFLNNISKQSSIKCKKIGPYILGILSFYFYINSQNYWSRYFWKSKIRNPFNYSIESISFLYSHFRLRSSFLIKPK